MLYQLTDDYNDVLAAANTVQHLAVAAAAITAAEVGERRALTLFDLLAVREFNELYDLNERLRVLRVPFYAERAERGEPKRVVPVALSISERLIHNVDLSPEMKQVRADLLQHAGEYLARVNNDFLYDYECEITGAVGRAVQVGVYVR